MSDPQPDRGHGLIRTHTIQLRHPSRSRPPDAARRPNRFVVEALGGPFAAGVVARRTHLGPVSIRFGPEPRVGSGIHPASRKPRRAEALLSNSPPEPASHPGSESGGIRVGRSTCSGSSRELPSSPRPPYTRPRAPPALRGGGGGGGGGVLAGGVTACHGGVTAVSRRWQRLRGPRGGRRGRGAGWGGGGGAGG
jgi:hypothetical protein